jgi:2-succinyl-5-enolpyruvyl-6-hydroxy-3-cyclohexene-1-carboxylate synthase
MVPDERSAAYRALGYSLASGEVVGLFCTSGTSALNFGPAIAEAFYQKAKLFVLTADRPPELIDQQEGQAIRQNDLFRAHTVFSAVVPSYDFHPAAIQHALRLYNQAWQACSGLNPGPVHLNFPFREPFYPEGTEASNANSEAGVFVKAVYPQARLSREELSFLIEKWNAAPRRLLLAGQMPFDHDLSNACKALSEYACCPVLGDALHNMEALPSSILHPDLLPENFLSSKDARPDILISIGNGHISKNVKKFLVENPPKEHWHVQEAGYPADAFGSLTQVIYSSPEWFITKLAEGSCFSPVTEKEKSVLWLDSWVSKENQIRHNLPERLSHAEFSDLSVVSDLLNFLPADGILCLGNSMPVRYAMWLHGGKNRGEIFANRGTSGIDGCVSSAIGVAEARPEQSVFLLIGDMGFLYDRNGLWTNNIPPNLKIVILNNAGGNIFRILPASSGLPEMPEYFEMQQNQTSEGICLDAGIQRFTVRNAQDLKMMLPDWVAHPAIAVLEVFTDKVQNQMDVKKFRDFFRNLHANEK